MANTIGASAEQHARLAFAICKHQDPTTPGPGPRNAADARIGSTSPTMTSRTPAEFPAADALVRAGYKTWLTPRQVHPWMHPSVTPPGLASTKDCRNYAVLTNHMWHAPHGPKQGEKRKDTRNRVLHWVNWDFASKSNTKLILLLTVTTPRKSAVVFTRNVEHGVRSWGTNSAASPPLAQGASRALDSQVQFLPFCVSYFH